VRGYRLVAVLFIQIRPGLAVVLIWIILVASSFN
jgi:hypothetical protein